jgi:hypothetical protein
MLIMQRKSFVLVLICFILAATTVTSIGNQSKSGRIIISSDKALKNGKLVLEKFLYNDIDGIPFGIAVFDTSVSLEENVRSKTKIVSSNPNIVKATEKGLYAVNPGETTISYTYGDYRKSVIVKVIDSQPKEYYSTVEEIVFTNKGHSKYIQIFAEPLTSEKIKINHVVEWESNNSDIATVGENGWVTAQGKGKTEIVCDFKDYKKIIPVTVLSDEYDDNAKDLIVRQEKRINSIRSVAGNNSHTLLASGQLTRDDVRDRCSIMFNWGWTPTQDLPQWGTGVFPANVYVMGLPYSQGPQCDGDGSLTTGLSNYFVGGFSQAMTMSNFYTPAYNGTDDYPRYGNDCSGYASIAYNQNRMNTDGFENAIIAGTTFEKVGSYVISDDINNNDLLAAYLLLERSDGLVYNYWKTVNGVPKLFGHVAIVGNAIYPGGVYIYEQKKPKTQLTWKSHTDLADSNYMPFTMVDW